MCDRYSCHNTQVILCVLEASWQVLDTTSIYLLQQKGQQAEDGTLWTKVELKSDGIRGNWHIHSTVWQQKELLAVQYGPVHLSEHCSVTERNRV